MFTGIVQAVGEVAELRRRGGDLRLRIRAGKLDLAGVCPGASICTSGVCLTVTALCADGYWCDVSNETRAVTTLGDLEVGGKVNLEKSLTPRCPLGGHIVSGHVDGVGELLRRAPDGRSTRWTLRAPPELGKYIAPKGSICVDGVSLTVNSARGGDFEVNIIPHTMAETTLAGHEEGGRVNLEVDVIARYLERLLRGERATAPAPLAARGRK